MSGGNLKNIIVLLAIVGAAISFTLFKAQQKQQELTRQQEAAVAAPSPTAPDKEEQATIDQLSAPLSTVPIQPTPEVTEASPTPEVKLTDDQKRGMEQMRKAMEDTKTKMAEAFASEANARKTMADMSKCVSMPQDKFQEQILKSSPSKLPEDIKTELPSLALMAQARCYSMAEALAKKYPNLKDEFQNQIEKKISKKAKMFTQQGFAPPADMTPFPPPGAPPQGIPLAPPQDMPKVPPAASPAK